MIPMSMSKANETSLRRKPRQFRQVVGFTQSQVASAVPQWRLTGVFRRHICFVASRFQILMMTEGIQSRGITLM